MTSKAVNKMTSIYRKNIEVLPVPIKIHYEATEDSQNLSLMRLGDASILQYVSFTLPTACQL